MNDSRSRETIDKFTNGAWTVLPDSGILSNEKGNEIYLEPRLTRLFYLLCKNSNTMISREQLIDQVWPDTTVNEESLTKAISDLRKLLKAHLENPPQIKTVPKRGYKMIILMPAVKRAVWKDIFKYIIYSLLIFILLILVIRGLNY